MISVRKTQNKTNLHYLLDTVQCGNIFQSSIIRLQIINFLSAVFMALEAASTAVVTAFMID